VIVPILIELLVELHLPLSMHSGLSIELLLNDGSEQFILDQLVSAIVGLDLVVGVETVLPFDGLVLVDADQVDFALLGLEVVVDKLEEHHALAALSVVLNHNP
jgi:hypothetical protein